MVVSGRGVYENLWRALVQRVYVCERRQLSLPGVAKAEGGVGAMAAVLDGRSSRFGDLLEFFHPPLLGGRSLVALKPRHACLLAVMGDV